MTFTSEYERMRPLDEDRHDRAVVFTHKRERPFDSQKWFIDHFLPSFDPLIHRLDRKRPIAVEIKNRPFYERPVYERPKWKYDPYKEALPEPEPPVVIPRQGLCFCGAQSTYFIRDQWVCLNHVNP